MSHQTLASSNQHNSNGNPRTSYRPPEVGRGQLRLKQAIETLERRRALHWSEMRRLRISIDELLKAHPTLGDKFAAVHAHWQSSSCSHQLVYILFLYQGSNFGNELVVYLQLEESVLSPEETTKRSLALSKNQNGPRL